MIVGMKNIGVGIFIIGGLISLSLTLKYLPAGILFMLSLPLFPFFGLYAGATSGDWLPSISLFGAWGVAAVLISLNEKVSAE